MALMPTTALISIHSNPYLTFEGEYRAYRQQSVTAFYMRRLDDRACRLQWR
jgi:hypothetical protein